MTEEYELSSYDRHELNHDQTALGRLPLSTSQDVSIQVVSTSLNYLSKKFGGEKINSKPNLISNP